MSANPFVEKFRSYSRDRIGRFAGKGGAGGGGGAADGGAGGGGAADGATASTLSQAKRTAGSSANHEIADELNRGVRHGQIGYEQAGAAMALHLNNNKATDVRVKKTYSNAGSHVIVSHSEPTHIATSSRQSSNQDRSPSAFGASQRTSYVFTKREAPSATRKPGDVNPFLHGGG